MIPAHVVEITTPKRIALDGLWFGPKRPKTVVIWVHGLGSTMFSKVRINRLLTNKDTAVLAFNNRGHDAVSKLRSVDGKRLGLAGAAHEKFVDCVDDIEGAISFARRSKAKRIFLAGHSTGCQKSIYWALKKGRGVAGIILLAPVSDYAGALKNHGKAKLSRVEKYARKLVREGKANELIPISMWSEDLDDAQRFLSLYTPNSIEEIFSYAQMGKRPETLHEVRIPTLVVWAENDEFADRPAKQAAVWFEKNLKNKHKVVIVPKVGHSFKGGEKRVALEIAKFMKES